jgi:hypothetical protein
MFKISLSIEHIAKAVNLSCDIVDLRHFFNNFNLEKFISAEATATGIVKRVQ